MEPSDEARELADYIISEILQDPRHEDIVIQVAAAIDDHTAALRAEAWKLQVRGGWYRSDQTLPPFNVRVRLWARFLEDGKLSKGEESHGTRIEVFKSEAWAREWIWDTPDGTTDESEDYGRRYTHWQYITPPADE